MDTKLKGDIAEQAFVLHALRHDWNVLKPFGDRLPYDLVLESQDVFLKIQVKSAWFDTKSSNYVIDTRRTKANRRKILRESYQEEDFDFAAVYIEDLDIFYIFPVEVFLSYGSSIHFVESVKRQRFPRSFKYRDAWNILSDRAAEVVTFLRNSLNSVKPLSDGNTEPSTEKFSTGVETGNGASDLVKEDEGTVQTTNC